MKCGQKVYLFGVNLESIRHKSKQQQKKATKSNEQNKVLEGENENIVNIFKKFYKMFKMTKA